MTSGLWVTSVIKPFEAPGSHAARRGCLQSWVQESPKRAQQKMAKPLSCCYTDQFVLIQFGSVVMTRAHLGFGHLIQTEGINH